MLSIPIINAKCSADTRQAYYDRLTEAGADRVFLFVSNPFGNEEQLARSMEQLSENLRFFGDPGTSGRRPLETAVWIGGLGHGGTLAHETEIRTAGFTKIRGLGSGTDSADSFCPLDPGYRAMYADFVVRIARAGAKMIMIDDDLRLAFHGAAVQGCACDRHLALFNRRARDAGLTDHDYTREELASSLFTGPATPMRQVWLTLMGDTLRDFARDLRRALDTVDPSVRLGHCACLSTWDLDGVDSIELSRIFAGTTRPFLRLIGAPYWNVNHTFRTAGLGSIVNLNRMQYAWCREFAPEIELMTEGDVYPRPRFNTPASYLEGLHQILTADGCPDILKYMLDYVHDPRYETGYTTLHTRKAPLRKQLADAFANTEGAGIYIYESMHRLASMDCTGLTEAALFERFTPASANYAARLSLPVSYIRTSHTPVTLVFGESARTVPASCLDAHLLLDAPAARILSERGFDTGVTGMEPMAPPAAETFTATGRTFPADSSARYWHMKPVDGAEISSVYPNGVPAVCHYTTPAGKIVTVYAFDMESVRWNHEMMKNYDRQLQLPLWQEDGRPVLPRFPEEPGLYPLYRKSGDRLVLGLWSLSDDFVMPREYALDHIYPVCRPIGTTNVSSAGDKVCFGEEIPPYCFAGAVLEK